MNLSRSRIAAVCAVALGVAIPTAGAALGIAASSPTSPPYVGPSSTTPTTPDSYATTVSESLPLKCISRADTDGGPSLPPTNIAITAHLTVPNSYVTGDSVFDGPHPVVATFDLTAGLSGLGATNATPQSVRFLSGSADVYLTGASSPSAALDLTPSGVTSPYGPVTLTSSLRGTSPTVTGTLGDHVGITLGGGIGWRIETYANPDGTGSPIQYDIGCNYFYSYEGLPPVTASVAVFDTAATPTTPGSTPTGSTPGSTPTGSTPTGSTPGSTPTGSTPTTPLINDPSAPAIRSSFGIGFGYIGGLFGALGDHLDNTTVLVGAKQGRVLLGLPNVVIAVAPPQPPGRYSVVLHSAAHGDSTVDSVPTFLDYNPLF